MEEEIHGGFYEIGAYRHNVRRYKEGIEQLNDIQSMLKVTFIVNQSVVFSIWESSLASEAFLITKDLFV